MIIALSVAVAFLVLANIGLHNQRELHKRNSEQYESLWKHAVDEYERLERVGDVQREIDNNPILAAVYQKLVNQTRKGLLKYGNTVNKDEYTEDEWNEHLQEELIDALVYSETRKQKRSGE